MLMIRTAFFLCTLILFFSSCAGNHSAGGKKFQVSGSISVEVPDCSGSGSVGKKAMPNAVYYIKKSSFNDPAVIADEMLKCNENGEFKLKLSAGTYTIVHADKLLSFAEFKLKHSSKSTYYQNLDQDCFLNWYKSPDFLLTVTGNMEVSWTVKSRCYTEQNPCIRYTGPVDR